MNFDIFFISFQEINCENHWQRVVDMYPNAMRLHGIEGINRVHVTCDHLAKTRHYWTVDGDNYLIRPLEFQPEFDLHMFQAYDPVFDDYTALGGVKLWKKGSIVNNDMRYGDFCLNATQTKKVEMNSFSISKYNENEFDAWKTAFRHCVKLLSPILKNRPNAKNIDFYVDRWKSSANYSTLNAQKCHQGYLDAQLFVDSCNGDMQLLNQINDYKFLKDYYARVNSVKSNLSNI